MGKLMGIIGQALRKIIYHGCFATIGLISAVARFAADFHIGKADAEIAEAIRLFGTFNKQQTVSAAIGLGIFAFGAWLDLRRYAARGLKSEK